MSQIAPHLQTERRRPTLPSIPGNLRFFVLFTLLLLILFSLLRLVLILSTHSPELATARELFHATVVGVRFDFATASFISLPVLILCYIPWTAPWRGPRTRKVFLWGLTALLAGITLTSFGEFEFFREFQTRFNELALRYLVHPQTVGGMIWYDYPVLRYLAVWLAVTAALHLALRWIMRVSYPRPLPQTVPQDTPPQETPPQETSLGPTSGKAGSRRVKPASLVRRLVPECVAAAVIFAVLIVGARGGLQGEPLRWGDAFEGPNEYANQMSLNGLYSLAVAGRDMSRRGNVAAGWKNKLPLPEARSIVRSLLVAPGETLVDPADRTVLRTGDAGSSLRLARADGKPVNVVVVMMESFSGRYSGSVGAATSYTPHFDALAKQGILFDRALSAGSHTHQGIFATQLGFPNLPGYETLMESSAGNQDFLSLSRIFEALGYQTYFLYNGDFEWDNMSGFFQKQGVNTFIGGDKMLAGAKFPDPVWGVSDTDLFERCNKEFEAASKKGPFMAAVMTLSNHSPYIVPPVPGAEPITGFPGRQNQRLEAFRYADHALSEFLEQAKTLSYFKDTLFVFVGDHGTNVLPMYTEVHLLFHHVPLLFYAPGLLAEKGSLQPRVDHRTASQLDVLPSILDLLGLNEAPRAPWGRSLFNNSFHDGGLAVFKQSGGGRAVAMAQGNRLLVLNSSAGHPMLMTFDLGPAPTITPLTDLPLQNRMERTLRAYLQAALYDLDHRAAGPPRPPDR